MADKPKDSAKATWLSRKFGAHADVDKMTPARQALSMTMHDMGAAKGIFIAMPVMIGMMGSMLNIISNEHAAPEVYSEQMAYSDTGDGYEVLKYSKDKPAIGLVREGDNVALYVILNNRWTLVTDEREAWSLASEAYAALSHHAQMGSQPLGIYNEVLEGGSVFPPQLWRYERVSKAWQDGNLIQRNGEGRQDIAISLRGMGDEYAAEAAEWGAIRTRMLESGYAATEHTDDIAAPQDTPNITEQALRGGTYGGAVGLLFVLAMGATRFSHEFKRRRRDVKRRP